MIDIKSLDLNAIERRIDIALGRRDFYPYCKVMYPQHYTEDRLFLEEICDTMQWFVEESDKRFLILNVPPRHYKSFTGGAFVEWVFGKYRGAPVVPKVITASYNERLSTTFATKVRDTIATKPVKGGPVVYRHVFPRTRIKYGQASKQQWALDGSTQDNYLATSPGGTATGFGADIGIIDDIIKSALEAYNENVLDGHWDWFTNTFMQRFEGDNWKCIVIMTRWATRDLAGRIMEAYPDECVNVSFPAVQKDGSMLCDSILNAKSYAIKTQEMNPDIIEANYNQKPIDVKGRLFKDFKTYEKLPEGAVATTTFNYTDTADTGTDFLCSVSYKFYEGDIYITGVYMSDAGMEDTEPGVADMFVETDTTNAMIESNNGGRGFRRNIERILKEAKAYIKCVFTDKAQTANKEARILTSSAWVQNHVYMPENWKQKFGKDFRDQLLNYMKKGKNAHDDAPDVMAGIYERHTKKQIEWGGAR